MSNEHLHTIISGFVLLGSRLEEFLERLCKVKGNRSLGTMINAFENQFCKKFRDTDKQNLAKATVKKMREFSEKRNRVIHWRKSRKAAKISLRKFLEVRNDCFSIADRLYKLTGELIAMEEIMLAPPLPYQMGNAGDLLKHGVLAEFAEWRAQTGGGAAMRLADPFGGRPWVDDPHREVILRLQSEGMSETALARAQNGVPNRYFGSSHLVKRAWENAGGADINLDVFVSDCDIIAADDLVRSAVHFVSKFRRLDEQGLKDFKIDDGFTILNAENKSFDLILLDPYGDFLRDEFWHAKPIKLPKITAFTKCRPNTAIVLFVLNLDPRNSVGQKYAEYKENHLSGAWEMTCPQIPDSPLKCEQKYQIEVLLIAPEMLRLPEAENLRKRLEKHAACLRETTHPDVLFGEIK